MASYDSSAIKTANGGYVLEAGEYTLSVRANAHTELDSVTFTVDSDVDYSVNGRESDNDVAVNRFQDYSTGNATFLSRADGFANYATATAAPTDFAMPDDVRAYEVGGAIGQEYADCHIYGWYGPAMNTHRTAFNGRNFEYYSEDGVLAGYIASAEVNAAGEKGVYAYIKHFVVNDQEINRCTVQRIHVTEQTMREIYMKPFELRVKNYDFDNNPLAVMTSFTLIGPKWTGANSDLLNGVLRGEWGFDGFVVSDWGGSNEHVEGVQAGSHLEMPTTGGDSDLELIQAVKDGKISEEIINQRVDEILDVILPVTVAVAPLEGKPFDMDAHHAMAQKAAGESIVLLKNEGGILPLKKGIKVAVIGEFARNARYQGAGSAVEMPWLDKCKAVIHGYLCGQAGAGAMLKAIMGEINPSGKLAESYPVKYADVSSAPYFPAKQRTAEYREGLYVGYRYYETANIPVLFPFGFGLSYTTFEYSDLKVTDKEATFTIANTGKMDGAEVAQLYVGKADAQVFRPAKELKGFQKVFLKAGESR